MYPLGKVLPQKHWHLCLEGEHQDISVTLQICVRLFGDFKDSSWSRAGQEPPSVDAGGVRRRQLQLSLFISSIIA